MSRGGGQGEAGGGTLNDSVPVLPVGTVTLLLADMEGSVRSWEADRAAMSAVAGRLDELVGEAVARHGGVRPVEQGEGDSFVAAFAKASDALACAVGLQQATACVDWPGGLSIRLRMALHTGEVQLRDEGNYIGAAINRCARLRDLAHGGQIVVSRATRDLVSDVGVEAASWVDLGTHRLRDLDRLEHVFQVCHAGLEREFPPLRSPGSSPARLPARLTTFIGRAVELAQVQRLLGESRLVVLTGSGGCGKTRLAVETAARIATQFPDGAWFVDLAAVSDPALVAEVTLAVLGLQADPGRPVADSLVAQLSDWRTLLVVDNCEHVIGACAALADRLLRECPNVTILATSRERLAVEGESAWRVPSLSVPGTEEVTPQKVSNSEALRLFVERAVESRPNFEITEANCGAIAEICQRLDGIPLAIELAAARARVLVPEQIAVGLKDRFDLLGHGLRTASVRHQTLATSIEWSHELLDEPERILFRRLSAFAGGFTLDAAEQVGAAPPIEAHKVLETLTGLVDKSLVIMEEQSGSARYRMLQTIRQDAADRLSAAGEEGETRDRHLGVFLALAEQAEPALRGPDLPRWLDRLETEHANLGLALEWSAHAQPELNLRLGSALMFFWYSSGHFSEGRRWVRDALAASQDIQPALRAKALLGVAQLALGAGDLPGAVGAAQESLAVARELGDAEPIGRALNVFGVGVLFTDPDAARTLLEESIAVARTITDTWTIGDSLACLGLIHFFKGDFARVRLVSQECIDIARKAGLQQQVGQALLNLGSALLFLGDIRQAQAMLEASVEELRGSDTTFLGAALSLLGETYSLQGAHAEARARLSEALELGRHIGSPFVVTPARYYLGRLALAFGDTESARSQFEEAVGLSRGMGTKLWLSWHLRDLGITSLLVGDAEAAKRQLDEALAVARDLGASQPIASALYGLGLIAYQTHEVLEAENLWHEALRLQMAAGDTVSVTDTLEALAIAATSQDSLDEGARLFAATVTSRDQLGYRRPSPNETHAQAQLDRLRAELEPGHFATRWEEGHELTLHAVTAYASRARGERKRPTSGWGSLTPTELEVVRLVAQGLTNKAIAERLFVAPSTVKTHLSSTFAKLGCSTRAELAAEATHQAIS